MPESREYGEASGDVYSEYVNPESIELMIHSNHPILYSHALGIVGVMVTGLILLDRTIDL